MSKIIVAPSILSADFANLERDVKKIEFAGADWVHIDVMDGHFVPNITIGAPVVKSLRKITDMTLDVHLMIENPEKYIKDFADAGADFITVHIEAPCANLEQTLKSIRAYGVKAGLSVKPKTPVANIEPYLNLVDMVLVMSVEPGFGGQGFIFESVKKVQDVKDLLLKHGISGVYIQVDGGIKADTAKLVINAGADSLVAGSYVYNASDIKGAISSLRK